MFSFNKEAYNRRVQSEFEHVCKKIQEKASIGENVILININNDLKHDVLKLLQPKLKESNATYNEYSVGSFSIKFKISHNET